MKGLRRVHDENNATKKEIWLFLYMKNKDNKAILSTF